MRRLRPVITKRRQLHDLEGPCLSYVTTHRVYDLPQHVHLLPEPVSLHGIAFWPRVRFPPNSGQVVKQLSLFLSETARTGSD